MMHNDRDVSIQGHVATRYDIFGDQGSQNIRERTHCFGTSRHPTVAAPEDEACTDFDDILGESI